MNEKNHREVFYNASEKPEKIDLKVKKEYIFHPGCLTFSKPFCVFYSLNINKLLGIFCAEILDFMKIFPGVRKNDILTQLK